MQPTVHQSQINKKLDNQATIAFMKQSTSQIFYDHLVSVYQEQFDQAEKAYWIANQAAIDGDYAIEPVYDFQFPEINFSSAKVFHPQAIDFSANVQISPTVNKKVKRKWWKHRLKPQVSPTNLVTSNYGLQQLKPIDWINLDWDQVHFLNPIATKAHWLNWKEHQMEADLSKTFAKQTIKAHYALEFSFDYYDLDQQNLLKREKFIVALSSAADIAYFAWLTISGSDQLENHIVCPHPQQWLRDLQIYIHKLCQIVINNHYLNQSQYEMHRMLINKTVAYLGNYLWPQGQISFSPNDLMHQYFSKILNINTFSKLFANRMASGEVFEQHQSWLIKELAKVFNFDHYLTWLKDQIYNQVHTIIKTIVASQHYQDHLDGNLSDQAICPQAKALKTSIDQVLKFDKISQHATIYYDFLIIIKDQWANLLTIQPPQLT